MPNRNNARIYRLRRRMFKKQKGLCHLCGKPMAISLERREDPQYATFDHLIPRSRGGQNSQENLKLAHKICNARRGATPLQKATWL